MSKFVFHTIVAKNYFGYARAWAKNVKKVYPDSPVYIFVADEFEGLINPAEESVPVIQCCDIGMEDFDYMKFIYEVTEFATSVKPFCISWLYDKHPGHVVVYMDSDTFVLTKMAELEEHFDKGADAVFTPHICEPLDDGFWPSEYSFLTAGIYNMGFGAFADKPEVRKFIKWWESKLAQHCVWALDKGIHVDQKWMDYATAFLEHAKVLRHPGYNIAYWNLPHRNIELKDGEWLSNSLPVRFVHVSGNDLRDKNNLSKHQNRYTRADLKDINQLIEVYQKNAIEAGQLETITWPYTFFKGRYFENIPFYLRMYFRERNDRFSMRGKDVEAYAYEYFMGKDDSLEDFGLDGMNRMALAYYSVREDLKTAFDLTTMQGQEKYLAWLKSNDIDLFYISGDRK
ncbi:MAG: hypothetical protein AB7E96_01210 [Deferribacterales bacterium]